jgi:hypothetical protein
MRIGLGGLVYLVIGVVVAATHHYLVHIQTAKAVLSAALAVLLWPLILLGVNLHIH